MAEENGSPGDAGAQLSPAMLAAIADAIQAGIAAAGPLAPPPVVSPLVIQTTPNLGLKMPQMDDQALITDLNANMVILDDAVTTTSVATLTNKTLTAPVINNPTITGWTNAQHTHLNTAGGGALNGAAITSGTVGTGNLVRESAVGSAGGTFINPILMDPIVRDSISWGPDPTGALDTWLTRGTAGKLALTSTGPAEWFTAKHASGGTVTARFGQAATATQTLLVHNADWDGTNWLRDDIAVRSWLLELAGPSGFSIYEVEPAANPMTGWLQKLNLSNQAVLTLGTAPYNWVAGMAGVQLGAGGAALSNSTFQGDSGTITFTYNTHVSTPWVWNSVGAGKATMFTMGPDFVWNLAAPAAAVNEAQTFVERLRLNDAWLRIMGAFTVRTAPPENLAGVWHEDAAGVRRSFVGMEGGDFIWRVYNAGATGTPGNKLQVNLTSNDVSTAGSILSGNGLYSSVGAFSTTVMSPASVVINPANALFHPVNGTVWLGHNTVPWTNCWVSGEIQAGTLNATTGMVKSQGGWVQAGSDGGAYARYWYDKIVYTWGARVIIQNAGNAGFAIEPSPTAQLLIIENAGNGLYCGAATLVCDWGRSDRRWWRVYCGSVDQSCTETVKEDILDLADEDVLADLLKTPIVQFRMKRPPKEDLPARMAEFNPPQTPKVGIIAERTPRRLLASDDSADPMSIAAAAIGGVKALHAQLAALREEVKQLKEAQAA